MPDAVVVAAVVALLDGFAFSSDVCPSSAFPPSFFFCPLTFVKSVPLNVRRMQHYIMYDVKLKRLILLCFGCSLNFYAIATELNSLIFIIQTANC
jgi:hypothetical protein